VLLRRALERDTGELTPHLLVNKARLRRDQGDLEAAVEALLDAEPHLARLDATEPRLVFSARCNLVDHLSLLGRHEEAECHLPAVWRLAKTAAGALDRLRLVWVGGRVAAGTGRVDEGLAALEQVRSDFAARGMAYDAALAALELAALYLDQGEPARVHSLVREMLPVFQCREIHREALAALRLFQQAVEEERATVALVRQLVAYLHRARYNPELRLALQPAPGSEPAAGKDRPGRPSGNGRKGTRKGGQ
jgi:tetratricopeptide (TPR) repeat protein